MFPRREQRPSGLPVSINGLEPLELIDSGDDILYLWCQACEMLVAVYGPNLDTNEVLKDRNKHMREEI